jgi:hypothetical protein
MAKGTGGWEKQFNRLFHTVKVETLHNIEIKRRTIEAALRGLNAQFMTQFVRETFGAGSTPSYARDQGTGWAPLTEKYALSKGDTAFYEKTGDLSDEFEGRTYGNTFGNARGKLITAASTGPDTGRAPAGGTFSASGNFHVGGRFTPKDDPGKWLPKGINVALFPRLRTGPLGNNEASARDIEAAVFGGASLEYFKLNNPGGGRNRRALERLRPAFGTFTLWWMKHKVQAILQQFDPEARMFR